MTDLTPERLDLIRSSCRRSVATSDKYPLITMDAADVLALLAAVDERDALAAKLDEVREWIDRRGVNVDDRDDDYMRGYRDAQRHARLDANELRVLLDATTLSAPCEVLDD